MRSSAKTCDKLSSVQEDYAALASGLEDASQKESPATWKPQANAEKLNGTSLIF